jgi:hypothetical protein
VQARNRHVQTSNARIFASNRQVQTPNGHVSASNRHVSAPNRNVPVSNGFLSFPNPRLQSSLWHLSKPIGQFLRQIVEFQHSIGSLHRPVGRLSPFGGFRCSLVIRLSTATSGEISDTRVLQLVRCLHRPVELVEHANDTMCFPTGTGIAPYSRSALSRIPCITHARSWPQRRLV